MGLPVITFNTGGSIETKDDTTGFIVEKGDLEEAIKTIRKIKTEGKEKYSELVLKEQINIIIKTTNSRNILSCMKV